MNALGLALLAVVVLALGLGFSIPQATAVVDTTVNVTCSASSAQPSPVPVGTAVNCSASVSGQAPTGTVSWTTSGVGTFSATTCTLEQVDVFGRCTVQYRPTDYPPSEVNISAVYGGDPNNHGSSGVFTMTVTQSISTTATAQQTSSSVQSSSTVQANQNEPTIQQVDTTPLALAIVAAGAMVAVAIVLSSRMKRS